ncbi:MAG: enoyl-CoA hydratase-related protein [Pseudomonadota bacterium]
MGYEFIKVEQDGPVLTVTINRPDVMNALHPTACREMNEVFNEFAADPGAWLAIVTGAGEKAFCAGNDLRWQAKHGPQALREGLDSLNGGFGGLTRRFDCFKPIIAAVNGLALGGGFEIVLACDVIICSEKAFFGLPEPKVGLMAAQGGVHRLPRRIPYHLAMGLMLTGDRLSAARALELGLVNEVASPDGVLAAAKAWAARILECAPLAVRATKEAAVQGLGMPLPEAVTRVFPGISRMRESQDYREGPRAFAAKRKPAWKGE